MAKFSKKRFHKINVEISNICNLQCSFCPEVVRSKKLMSVDLFEKIIRQIAPLTDQVCFHLMGDPLVHPKLEEFILICEKYEAPIYLVTNGVLLKEKLYPILLNPSLRQLNFSLHSFPDNYEDKDPTLYLNKIFQFTEMAFQQRPDLYINYRLWNLDHPEGTNSNNRRILEHIENHFKFTFDNHINVRNKKNYQITNRLFLHFDTEFIWPDVSLPILGNHGTCYGLKSHFGILVDGTVVPCCLDKEGRIPLGHVSEQPILDILETERSQNILKGFQNRRLVEDLCQRCQYIERFQNESR